MWRRLKLWWKQRADRYWNISETDARARAVSIQYEFGAVEAGKFMDEWKARQNENSN